MKNQLIAVLDAGKTHTKLTLWGADGVLRARRSRPNSIIDAGTYRALDAEGIERWCVSTLREFGDLGDIGTVIPVGHGAGIAVLRDGRLAYAPMDYEQPIPPLIQAEYRSIRDPFSITGSPLLPNGLNLGAQLYWLEKLHPGALNREAIILPWAQYWAWVFSGIASSEMTSLGCHTDLWLPVVGRASPLASARGWAQCLAPLRGAGDVLGTLSSDWASRTGLSPDVRILCGLHDSNAALLAARGFVEISNHEATVISTGTWFVAMRSPAADVAAACAGLAENRDCLVNVDVRGTPTPSARFMGGRESELLSRNAGESIDQTGDQTRLVNAVTDVVQTRAMVLPTLAPGSGPYPHACHEWRAEPSTADARRAAIAVYCALVADTSLDLVGARKRILVEGRFANAEAFTRTLASLRPETEVYASNAHDGVPYGALRLVDPQLVPRSPLKRVEPLEVSLGDYRDTWRYQADLLEHTG